jgi:hypothetical protein
MCPHVRVGCKGVAGVPVGLRRVRTKRWRQTPKGHNAGLTFCAVRHNHAMHAHTANNPHVCLRAQGACPPPPPPPGPPKPQTWSHTTRGKGKCRAAQTCVARRKAPHTSIKHDRAAHKSRRVGGARGVVRRALVVQGMSERMRLAGTRLRMACVKKHAHTQGNSQQPSTLRRATSLDQKDGANWAGEQAHTGLHGMPRAQCARLRQRQHPAPTTQCGRAGAPAPPHTHARACFHAPRGRWHEKTWRALWARQVRAGAPVPCARAAPRAPPRISHRRRAPCTVEAPHAHLASTHQRRHQNKAQHTQRARSARCRISVSAASPAAVRAPSQARTRCGRRVCARTAAHAARHSSHTVLAAAGEGAREQASS